MRPRRKGGGVAAAPSGCPAGRVRGRGLSRQGWGYEAPRGVRGKSSEFPLQLHFPSFSKKSFKRNPVAAGVAFLRNLTPPKSLSPPALPPS